MNWPPGPRSGNTSTSATPSTGVSWAFPRPASKCSPKIHPPCSLRGRSRRRRKTGKPSTLTPGTSRMKKALAVLAVSVLALAGVLWTGARMRQQAAAPRSPYADMVPGDVVRLHVAYLGDSVTLIRHAGNWVTARDRFPADTARLRRVLGHLLGMQVKEEVSRAPSGHPDDLNLAAYDLDTASARRVTWTMADGR